MRLLTITVACALVAAVVALGRPSSSHAGYYVKCAPFTGPKWASGSRRGTSYELLAHAARCPFATRWASALAAKRSPGPGKVLKGSPPGYRCSTSTPKGFLTTQGLCQKGTAANFSWAPELG